MFAFKRKAVLCGLALFAVAFCGDARQLQSNTECDASAFVEIFVFAGTCSAKAQASCEAISVARDSYKLAFEELFIDSSSNFKHAEVCAVAKRDAAALAIAKAVAKVTANAVVSAKCSSNAGGSACGFSVGRGTSFAAATAEAVAIAATEVSGGAICDTFITALSGVFAEAAADAGAAVCLEGPGQAFDYERKYVESVRIGIAQALASASAAFCQGKDLAKAKAECAGKATAGSIGSGSGGNLRPCFELSRNGDAKCCTDQTPEGRTTCAFKGPNGERVVWRLVRKESNRRIWKGLNGGPACVCA